jgi:hypothetical protein
MISATSIACTVTATFEHSWLLDVESCATLPVQAGNWSWAIKTEFDDADDSASFYLVNKSSSAVTVDFSLSYTYPPVVSDSVCVGVMVNKSFGPGSACGWKCPLKRSIFLHNQSADSVLVVSADIMFPMRDCLDRKEWHYHGKDHSASDTMKALYDDPSLLQPDVRILLPFPTYNTTVTASAIKIPAHKFVLITRSSVFRAMLTGSMREARDKAITIPNVEEAVVRAFVRFLYCDSCIAADLQAHALDLLAMADQYDVPPLLSVCEAYLSSHLTVKNMVEVLQAADLHGAPVLKEHALEYIAQNAWEFERGSVHFGEGVPEWVKDLARALARGKK